MRPRNSRRNSATFSGVDRRDGSDSDFGSGARAGVAGAGDGAVRHSILCESSNATSRAFSACRAANASCSVIIAVVNAWSHKRVDDSQAHREEWPRVASGNGSDAGGVRNRRDLSVADRDVVPYPQRALRQLGV